MLSPSLLEVATRVRFVHDMFSDQIRSSPDLTTYRTMLIRQTTSILVGSIQTGLHTGQGNKQLSGSNVMVSNVMVSADDVQLRCNYLLSYARSSLFRIKKRRLIAAPCQIVLLYRTALQHSAPTVTRGLTTGTITH